MKTANDYLAAIAKKNAAMFCANKIIIRVAELEKVIVEAWNDGNMAARDELPKDAPDFFKGIFR